MVRQCSVRFASDLIIIKEAADLCRIWGKVLSSGGNVVMWKVATLKPAVEFMVAEVGGGLGLDRLGPLRNPRLARCQNIDGDLDTLETDSLEYDDDLTEDT